MTSRASAPPPSDRTALVVAGMHRSGTSAMSRVLGLAGAGMPERVITAAADNPLGFWEPADVVALNNEILRAVGSEWNDVFGIRAAARSEPLWSDFVPRARSVVALNFAAMPLAVMKDPRVSLLAPLWREALTQEGFRPVFVIMVRDPIEVAGSIAARDGASVQASTLSWLSHMIAIERDTRDAPRVFVRYSDLIEDWRPVLARITETLGLTMPVSDKAAEDISRFLSRSARHHTTDEAEWTGRDDLWPGVAHAWRWLTAAADDRAAQTPFPAAIADELERLASRMEPSIASVREGFLRREHGFQAVLGDRERALLRLKAQADEQRIFAVDQGDLLTAAQRQVTRLTGAVETTIEETRRLGVSVDDLPDDADAADRLRAHVAVLKRQVSGLEDRARVAQLRTAELEHSQQTLAAATQDLALANQSLAQVTEELGLTQNHADNLTAALESVEARADALAENLTATEARRHEQELARIQAQALNQALQARIDAMSNSASWSLTRPIRVVQKRLHKS